MRKTIRVNSDDIVSLYGAIDTQFKKMKPEDKVTLFALDLMCLGDEIKKLYAHYVSESNKILFKYIEVENGEPKKKATILGIDGENKSSEYIWLNNDSEAKFNKEIEKFIAREYEIEILMHDASLLIDSNMTLSDTSYMVILKYISL